MIEVRSITKSFDGQKVLDDISFTVNEGECVALSGISGAGKTTLMRIIASLEKADSGEIIIKENTKKTYVFQENRLLENKTALENITAVVPDKKKAMYYLGRCLLQEDAHKKAGLLSGGMKRRLAIARALCYGGDIYFLDEPLRELDEETLSEISSFIKEEISGKTALLITHDESNIKYLADRVITINK